MSGWTLHLSRLSSLPPSVLRGGAPIGPMLPMSSDSVVDICQAKLSKSVRTLTQAQDHKSMPFTQEPVQIPGGVPGDSPLRPSPCFLPSPLCPFHDHCGQLISCHQTFFLTQLQRLHFRVIFGCKDDLAVTSATLLITGGNRNELAGKVAVPFPSPVLTCPSKSYALDQRRGYPSLN